MKTKNKNFKLRLTCQGKRVENVKHAQLRMKCSKLNYDLNLLHVTGSPACSCGHRCENANHFLLHCPLYGQIRAVMINDSREVTQVYVSRNLLLYGSDHLDFLTNSKIVKVVHSYLKSTERM